MNDEQFDRQVREAARRMAGEPASSALRARVAAIPAEHPRPARGIRRFTVGVRLAGAAAVLLVLVVAATLVVATLPRHNAVLPGATASPTASAARLIPQALSTADLGALLHAPGGLPSGSIVIAQLQLTLVSAVPSCPPAASCILGPAEWRIDGLSPDVTLDALPDASGLPSTGIHAAGLFALQGAPVKSGSRIYLLGLVTPGPNGLAWQVAQAATGSWPLAVIEGWLGAVNYAWPCPPPPSGGLDPLTQGYGCGHGEWLASTAAGPAAQQLTPTGALRVEAGAYASVAPDPSAAETPQPPALRGAYLVQAVPHSCPPSSDTQIERCAWLKVLGLIAATAPAATQGPSVAPATPSVDLGMPALSVPANQLRVAPLNDYPPQVQSGGAPTAPYAYLQGSGAVSLLVADAGGGSVRNVPLPLAAGEQIREVSADGTWLVVVTAQPGVPCALPTPTRVSWRILAAPLGSDGLPTGAFHQVDAGTATRSFILPGNQGLSCAEPAIAPLALAAGRVAYGVEAPSGTDLAASQVRVHSLADGSFVRTLAAPAQVYAVALSSSAVAWVETANGVTSGQRVDWRVMEALLPAGPAAAVPLGETGGATHPEPPGIVLDGTALVASLDQYEASSGTVVRVVGREVATLDPGHTQRNCGAVGAQGGLVVLECNGSVIQGDTATATGGWLAVWSSATGLRAVTGHALPTDVSQVSLVNGWVLWMGTDASGGPVLAALPLAALVTPGE